MTADDRAIPPGAVDPREGLIEGRCSPIQERWYRVRAANLAISTFPPFRYTQDFMLTGELDATVLAESFAALVRRQWSLRTAFHDQGERVWQVVVDASSARGLEVHDLRGVTDPAARCGEIVRDLYVRTFDLAGGEAFAAGLILLDDHRHRLVLGLDHMIRDAWSDVTLHRELFGIYTALLADPSRDPDAVLPVLEHPYIEWADQQWHLIEGEYGAHLREYWTTRLASASDVALPVDDPTPEAVGPAFVCRDSVAPDVLASVTALVEPSRKGTRREVLAGHLLARPLAMLAALFGMLHRLTGQRDLCVVVPTRATRAKSMLSVVGHFTVPLILRVEVDDDLSLRDLFARVASAYHEAQRWRRVPMYAVVQPPRGLLKVAFNYRRRPRSALPHGLVASAAPDRYCTDVYTDLDLILLLLDGEARIDATLIGRARAFKPDNLRALLRDYLELAADWLGSPDGRLADAGA